MNERFIKMYDDYFDDIYRYVLYKTGNRWDTDDLVSDIFRKAFQNFDKMRLENGKPWLLTIARNTVIDHYRSRKEWAYGHDPEIVGYMGVGELLDATELSNDCLKQSLLALSAEESEMINLKYIVGMKYAEMSEIVGKPDAWLKTKVHRIKQRMGLFINKCMEGQI